jgi:hypothetical protein
MDTRLAIIKNVRYIELNTLLEAVMHLGPKVHGAREHQTGKSDEVQPC